MTVPAPHATPKVPVAVEAMPALDAPAFPPAVAERLNRIRLHIDGLSHREIEQLVEQAFRNFHGLNTDRLVRYLTDRTA